MNHLDWALSVSGKRLKPSSLAVYRSMWRGLEERLGTAATRPTECSAADLSRALQGAGDYASQRRLFKLVCWVYETLGQAGLPVRNVCSELERLYRGQTRPMRSVDPEEDSSALVERALAVAPAQGGPFLAALAAVCAHTGLRTGQLLRLTLQDVDCRPEFSELTLRSKGEVRAWRLEGPAHDAMHNWLLVHPARESPRSALFAVRAHGNPPAASTLWRQLKTLDRPPAGPAGTQEEPAGSGHLRAGLAARLRAQGASVEEVRQALGHRQLSSTEELLSRITVRKR